MRLISAASSPRVFPKSRFLRWCRGGAAGNDSIPHSRSTGSVDPWLVENMRESETYGSWVWAAESPRGATDQDGRVAKSAAQYMYTAGNPVGFRDPWGLKQTDKKGNPIWAPDPVQLSGGKWVTGYLYANNGTKIRAAQPRQPNIPPVGPYTPAQQKMLDDYNERKTGCHDFTFANGQYWINNGEVDKILADDGYRGLPGPPKGTFEKPVIVIFRDGEGKVVHSEFLTNSNSDDVEIFGLVDHETDTLKRTLADRTAQFLKHGIEVDPDKTQHKTQQV